MSSQSSDELQERAVQEMLATFRVLRQAIGFFLAVEVVACVLKEEGIREEIDRVKITPEELRSLEEKFRRAENIFVCRNQ